ncbi:ABC transporter ATP-binding protein [Streptomyces sp. WMMC500]|uniref:ATP-binding cassette domain-containing protein n=1 Tax=Streptomyces sp. WMMC500 TaxID=3015154 RepID=UPI00248D023A|nr:ABC transporter ATP-binding protein [Streptomyces sp. WMMC500]WBB64403.1 ABC transporter ATP-binding protein [Streptomyces sp. WMMC500]
MLGVALDRVLTDSPDAPRALALCAALTAAVILLDAAETVLNGVTTARTTAWLRRRLLGAALATEPRHAAGLDTGDLVTRATGNAAHAGAAPTAAASALGALLTPVGALVALAVIDPWLAVVLGVGTPVLVLLLRAFVRSAGDCVTRYQEAQAAIAARLAEALAGARTIAAAGTVGRERSRALGPLPELSRHGHRMWHVQGRATAQAAVVVPLLQLAVVAVAGLRLGAGRLSVGELLAAGRYAMLAGGIGVLVGHVNTLVRSRAAARRLTPVLRLPPIPYGPDTAPAPAAGGRLELRGVTVRRGGRTVLRGLDLTVPAGATVAVVGRSGAGKSLLAAVAGRLTDPDGGDVRLDGVPLAGLARTELRAAVAYAFARPALLGGTVAEALAYADARTPIAADRAVAAARAADADAFVRALPAGYATPAADVPLSGGELQRLGLARAFARDARLLIMDDALSGLDTATELRIERALLAPGGAPGSGSGADGRPRFGGGGGGGGGTDSGAEGGDAALRTRVRAARGSRLVVAHRAATAARADLVAWLDGGRVRALRPHTELCADPAYRALWDEEPPGA